VPGSLFGGSGLSIRWHDIRAGRVKLPNLEGGAAIDEDRTILEVAVEEWSTLQVVALDCGGTEGVIALGPREP
jgi:hypothetical protein